jgi:hypothetical protein
LRALTGELKLSAFRHWKSEAVSSDRSRESFIGAQDEIRHALTIEANRSALRVFTSCNDQEKSPVTTYQLVDYQILD